MKLYKELISGVGDRNYLGMFPTRKLIEYAGVLVIETDDNYVVYKNRWVHHELGDLFMEDLDGNTTSIKDLDYKRITCKMMNGLNDYNPNQSKEKLDWLRDFCMKNKYILFDVAIDRVD